MDYEQKYKKALERAKEIHDEQRAQPFNVMTKVFPELKESEDERIRQFLIHEVTETSDEIMSYRNMNKKDVLAWLEKQGEQRPAWSEGDNKMLRFIGNAITADDASIYLKSKGVQIIDAHMWLEELKKRVLPQPEQEWSEEDEKLLNDAISLADDCDDIELRDWLKSLRPQSTWKPSDEQMKALSTINVTGGISYAGQGQELINLFNDLKKLKG